MKKLLPIFFVFLFSIIINISNARANSIDNKLSNEKLDEVEIQKNKKVQNLNPRNNSSDDIFGDEQTFPFVAGLGKNAAH
tara:strand:- start:146 stop:385 length:240 start_codon:yes stop_codon:yes gene_type:complete